MSSIVGVFQKSHQASDVQIESRAFACATTLMSGRMPRILRLPLLGCAELSGHGQKTFMAGVEPGL